MSSGLQEKESEPAQSSDETAPENSGTEGTEPTKQSIPNKNQMQPQQFNAWLNLFSELDPIAQSKSGNVA